MPPPSPTVPRELRNSSFADHSSLRLQTATNLTCLALPWTLLFYQLSFEWSVNGQYSFGLMVPFLGLYLLHLRWESRPAPDSDPLGPPTVIFALLAMATLLLYPAKVIFHANADWRLIIWGQTCLTLLITAALLWSWGGRSWLIHFIFPFIYFLSAVPWPRHFENQLVLGLMGIIAGATVEALNMLGVYAQQSGNIIALSTGLVSVEEACSGVRSFQSTIMGALFLGELFRFRISLRLALILGGAALALFYNFCRTLSLALISASRGTEVMNQWHDPAGYLVFIASIGSLALISWAFHRFNRRKSPSTPSSGTRSYPRWLPLKPTAVLAGLLILSHPFTLAWFAIRGPTPHQPEGWTVDWKSHPLNLRFEPIEPAIREILFYDFGEQVKWETPNGFQWLAFFFRWESGRSAQLGGVHNPEVCLPAVGWTMEESAPDLHWEGPGGLSLIFNSYRFRHREREVYVFYCQWDPQGYPYHTKLGRYRQDRLHDAWIGDRKAGKQKLEIVIEGPGSMDEAKSALKSYLAGAIQPG